ncbi:MAG: ATP-binding protein [Eubacterium sp.]|nr:ATP-binding protein [Eubacterium sp.]
MEKKKNPYNIMFGKEPAQVISRLPQLTEVINSFQEDESNIYMITGVRGSGKTVFMTEVSKEFDAEEDWITVELNSSANLLEDLLDSLVSDNYLAKIFQSASINLSLFGVGLEVSNSVPISSRQVALEKMLKSIKKQNKKVLICIDEVTVTEQLKIFAGAFQIFMRKDLPVYLMMTGLFENIDDMRNEKNLTFLYRAPRIEIRPLNLEVVANNYRNNLGVDVKDSNYLANLTKGYSYAFQLLGYFTWKNAGDYKEAIPIVKQYLEENVYEKIWMEISSTDKRLLYGISKSESSKAKEIKAIAELSDDAYSVYRGRLIKKRLVDGSEHGYLKFTLPLFNEFVIRKYMQDRMPV